MSAKDKQVQRFYINDDLVYRRKMNLSEIGEEIMTRALRTIDLVNYDKMSEDERAAIMDNVNLAVDKFIDSLRKSTSVILKGITRHKYRHIGYYNDVPDIRELSRKSADEIVDYCRKGYGKFYEDDVHEPETDLIKEEESNAIERGDVKFTSDGKYAIYDSSPEDWREVFKDSEDGDASDAYIDIYELY